MSRIPAIDPTTATGKTRDMLDAVNKSLGVTPNLFRVTAQSPAALEGMLALNGAVARSTLGARVREAIALTVAEVDACDYCLSAHTALGRGAGLSDADIAQARAGEGQDARLAAAVRFARAVAEKRGAVSEAELTAARRAGLSDAEILDAVAAVALNVFTNYVNTVAGTDIDFPVVRHNPR